MGIFKAAAGSFGGVMADQWKEYYLCDGLPGSVLVQKVRRMQTDRGANTKGDPNVVSDGSCIVVNEGQCGLVVDGGRVVSEFPLPGEHTFHSQHSPSIFGGAGLGGIARDMGRRFTFGGEVPIWQAVYYVNTKELPGEPVTVENAIPFRFRDPGTGLDLDGGVVCQIFYTFRITAPGLFFTKVSGSVQDSFPKSRLDRQMGEEVRSALQAALPELAGEGIRPSQLGEHPLEQRLTRVLTEKWAALRGIQVVSMAISGLRAAEGDMAQIQSLQFSAPLKDSVMAGAVMTGAAAQAMEQAAENPGGAVMGLAAMSMAAGGAGTWQCRCGHLNSGKFCTECGAAGPWQCRCGHTNTGNFCTECGLPRPGGSRRE